MKVTIRQRKLKKGAQLYIDIYHKGLRLRENLDIVLDGNKNYDEEKRRMAEILRAKREVELLADLHGLVASHRGEVPFVVYAQEVGGAGIDRSIDRLKEFFGLVQIRAVTLDRSKGYQDALVASGLAKSTVETYMNAYMAVLNRAVADKILRENPAKGMARVKAEEKAPQSLTLEELARLEATPIMGEDGVGGEIKRAFRFSCRTGLRWSEDCTLTYGKIRTMSVPGEDGKKRVVRQVETTQVKTKKVVYVPLNAEAWSLVDPGDRIPAHDERVFPLLSLYTDPNQYTHPWGEAAKVHGLNFHRSRHTFVRQVLDAGADLVTAQNLAGHKKIETTAKYGRASDKTKREAVERMGKS